MKNDFCIIYIATSEKYRSECLQSVVSVKAVMPDVPIILWTDSFPRSGSNYFDNIYIIDSPEFSKSDKISQLTRTNCTKNVFLDTDTYVLHSFYEISDLLENFDIAVSHAPRRISNCIDYGIPVCFPPLNTGVIAFKNNQSTIRLFKEWKIIYDHHLKNAHHSVPDQPAFRKALYSSNTHFTILPPEYNIRTIFPAFKGGHCLVKILHGRGDSLKNAIKKVNYSYNNIEIYYFQRDQYIQSKKRQIKKRTVELIQQLGFGSDKIKDTNQKINR